MPKFDEDENLRLDKQIRINTYDMTKKIKECEEIIKEISCQKIENFQESTSKKFLFKNFLILNIFSKRKYEAKSCK